MFKTVGAELRFADPTLCQNVTIGHEITGTCGASSWVWHDALVMVVREYGCFDVVEAQFVSITGYRRSHCCVLGAPAKARSRRKRSDTCTRLLNQGVSSYSMQHPLPELSSSENDAHSFDKEESKTCLNSSGWGLDKPALVSTVNCAEPNERPLSSSCIMSAVERCANAEF